MTMPKLIDFPRASLDRSMDLARAVDSLGGDCSKEMCASKMGRKTGGAFEAIVGSAVKFGLVERGKDRLQTTERFREHKLAYSEGEGQQVLRAAFLDVPVFRKVIERFKGQRVPIDILDKLLVKEFQVPESQASRVSTYLLEGAKQTGLIDDSGSVYADAPQEPEGAPKDDPTSDASNSSIASKTLQESPPDEKGLFVASIRGPGMRTEIALRETEDLAIVEVMLSRVRRILEEQD